MNNGENIMRKEQYLVNPCANLSIPYWKRQLFKQSKNGLVWFMNSGQ